MLHNLDINEFLSNYWQKSPCLIKNALRHPPDYISADELAGLSLEEDVESRIIRNDNAQWQLLHGPFEPEIYSKLPESNWTLLIQTVEFWVPTVSEFLSLFSFIPRWRFDDLMVSYATDRGGVGPHYDNYDVFLVQGAGERRWRVGQKGDIGNGQTIIDGLKHTDPFEPVIDVIMQPGDILYIPPDTPHWGESIGESIGYSVGYRAPQVKELVGLIAEHLESQSDSSFFSDPYRSQLNPHSKLEPELINWAKQSIQNIANNQELIETILSKYLSEDKLPIEQEETEISLPDLQNINEIALADGVNFNWVESEHSLKLSISGETCEVDKKFKLKIETLLSQQSLALQGLKSIHEKVDFLKSLSSLINKGLILVKK